MPSLIPTKWMHWVSVPLAVAALFGTAYGLHRHLVPERPGLTRPLLSPLTASLSNPLIHQAQANAPVSGQQITAPSAYITLPNFASIAASQGAAVVNISVTGSVKTTGVQGLDPNDPLAEWFRRLQPNLPAQETPVRGQGSGFIVSADGLVLTNAHVVDHADTVTVKLSDRREFQAKVLGTDRLTDVAVLKIDARQLPTVRIGQPQQSHVGDWVVAIGSPYGFENSVTAGIISAKSRALPDEGYVPFLQTDVAINPGNSGGPLFNLNGEVIGINAQIYSRSGGYQGLSFAIPIDVAMHIQQQLVSQGKVSRGRLGLGVQPLNQALAQSFGLQTPDGALVSQVEPAGPAAKAGIQAGDVIVRFNNQPIVSANDLPPLVANTPPGSRASLQVWRNKQLKTVTLKVDALPSPEAVNVAQQTPAQPRLGVSVRPYQADDTSQAPHGLLVEQVAEGPAAKAGLQTGDVILAVNGSPVNAVAELQNALKPHRKQVALLVMRGEQTLYVPVKLG